MRIAGVHSSDDRFEVGKTVWIPAVICEMNDDDYVVALRMVDDTIYRYKVPNEDNAEVAFEKIIAALRAAKKR